MATTSIKNGLRSRGKNLKASNGGTVKNGVELHNGDSSRKRKTDSVEEETELKKIRTAPQEYTDSSAPKKKWIINAFAMQSPGHLNPGLFKHPDDKGRQYNDIKNWISLAKKLEDAKFHAIFFADVLGGYDVYKGPANLTPTIPAAAQFPINDPLYAVSASMYLTILFCGHC
jgi:hypothetical protein